MRAALRSGTTAENGSQAPSVWCTSACRACRHPSGVTDRRPRSRAPRPCMPAVNSSDRVETQRTLARSRRAASAMARSSGLREDLAPKAPPT